MIRGYPYFRKPPYSTLRGITWRRRCTQNFSTYIFWCHLDWIRGGVLLKSIQDLMPRNILGKFSALSPSVDLVRFPDISKCSWHMLALVGTSFGKFFMKLSGFQAWTSVAACPKRMTRELPWKSHGKIPCFHEPNQWNYRQQNYETSNLGCRFCVNPMGNPMSGHPQTMPWKKVWFGDQRNEPHKAPVFNPWRDPHQELWRYRLQRWLVDFLGPGKDHWLIRLDQIWSDRMMPPEWSCDICLRPPKAKRRGKPRWSLLVLVWLKRLVPQTIGSHYSTNRW